MIKLTSVRRLLLFCAGQSTPITDNVANRRVMENWINSVSHQIQTEFLYRNLELSTYIEYFDMDSALNEFWVKNYPITSLTGVYEDSTGLWSDAGSEIEDPIVDYSIGRVTVPYNFRYDGNKAIKIVYVGGLAYDPVESIFTLEDGSSENWESNKYVYGNTSGAVAIVKSYASDNLTVEQYYGKFVTGELLTQYDDEIAMVSSPSVTGTLSSFSRESLLNSNPNLVSACEMQIRYMRHHQTDFENTGTTKDGVTVRNLNPILPRIPLRDEVIQMIGSYQRTWNI